MWAKSEILKRPPLSVERRSAQRCLRSKCRLSVGYMEGQPGEVSAKCDVDYFGVCRIEEQAVFQLNLVQGDVALAKTYSSLLFVLVSSTFRVALAKSRLVSSRSTALDRFRLQFGLGSTESRLVSTKFVLVSVLTKLRPVRLYIGLFGCSWRPCWDGRRNRLQRQTPRRKHRDSESAPPIDRPRTTRPTNRMTDRPSDRRPSRERRRRGCRSSTGGRACGASSHACCRAARSGASASGRPAPWPAPEARRGSWRCGSTKPASCMRMQRCPHGCVCVCVYA